MLPYSHLVFLEEESDLGSSAQGLAIDIPGDSEGPTGLRLPDVLLIVVVLGRHNHLLGNEVSRVEPNAELPDHAHICPGLQRLHELLRPRLGNRPQVVHQI